LLTGLALFQVFEPCVEHFFDAAQFLMPSRTHFVEARIHMAAQIVDA
jgi:hypothetical protein